MLVFGRYFTPDPAGRAHDAPPDRLGTATHWRRRQKWCENNALLLYHFSGNI